MTQQEKQLLLVDLCARLPYSVKCYFEKDGGKSPVHVVTIGLFADVANRDDVICKPYLRPMSSMTEDEEREVRILWNEDFADKVSLYHCYPKTTDFYNSHHFDYRGLIEKGLALEAPEGMYN